MPIGRPLVALHLTMEERLELSGFASSQACLPHNLST